MQDVKEKIPFLNSDQREKETAVIGRVSMVAGFREVKLSRSRKFKTRYFPGGKTKDIQYLLVPYLKKSPDNIIIHITTKDLPCKNKDVIYKELSNVKITVNKLRPN